MTDDMHSIARRIEALDVIIDDANADKAVVWKDAKRVPGLEVAALRDALRERRKRDKNPAAYEALKGRAADYLDALDNGIVLEHARAPARARKAPQQSEAGTSTRKGEDETGTTPKVGAGHKARNPASDTPSPTSTGGSTSPPAGNDAAAPSSAAASPPVETPKLEDGDSVTSEAVTTIPPYCTSGLDVEKAAPVTTPDDNPIPDFLNRVQAPAPRSA